VTQRAACAPIHFCCDGFMAADFASELLAAENGLARCDARRESRQAHVARGGPRFEQGATSGFRARDGAIGGIVGSRTHEDGQGQIRICRLLLWRERFEVLQFNECARTRGKALVVV
jgi:hypothetical protein